MVTDDHEAMTGNMLLHVNLLALRALLVKLMEERFLATGDPAGKADEWLSLFGAAADRMTFPDATPEWSDLAAQEFRDILVQMIDQARALAMRRPATDPAAAGVRRPRAA
ncbi:hypothetical protein [Azospirillum halopraeferens]|uniref:hypothetical protein n=1 Tax=Azospirillum halopraeferens TaxID=34010 RepID=UPI000A06E532|nr:hypothetical protein [Azospirillum halopraeferens]